MSEPTVTDTSKHEADYRDAESAERAELHHVIGAVRFLATSKHIYRLRDLQSRLLDVIDGYDRAEAKAAKAFEERTASHVCEDCHGTGIYESETGRGWPCLACNTNAVSVAWENRPSAPLAEVRAFLDALEASHA